MPRKVRGPDGVVRLFPDDATDAEIAQALEGVGKEPSVMAPQPSLLDRGVNLLPSIGGTVGGILGGTGGTAFGMGFGGVPGAIGGATLGGAFGEALRQLSDRFRGIEAPATSGQAATDIVKEGGLQGGAEAAGAGLSKYVIAPAAKSVMRGYLKPSLAGTKIGEAREIVQTALDEALPVTKGGERRAGRLIDEINKQVNGILADADGQTVDLHRVAQRVRGFAKAKYYKPGVDSADYQAALEVADSLDRHASQAVTKEVPVTKTVKSKILDASGNPIRTQVETTKKVTEYPSEISLTKANEIKQAVRPPSRAYGQQSYVPETATRKVAGSEMRRAIEQQAPEVRPLNAREERLINAQDAITRAAGREENKGLNPTAVPNLLAAIGGLGAGGYERDPASGLATAIALRMALSPAVMTRAAILASKIAKNGYAPAAAARMAIEMARSETEQEGNRRP